MAADPLPLGILEPPGALGRRHRASARARRWATGSTSAARRSASSPPTSASSARCRAGSRARRATWTASAASCSRCRRASSTSAARRPRTTSAPRRRSTRWPAWSTCPGSASAGLVELGELMLRRTHYARETLGLEADQPRPGRARVRRAGARPRRPVRARPRGGHQPRLPPGATTYPEYEDGLLVAITERRTQGRHRPAGRRGRRRARGGGGLMAAARSPRRARRRSRSTSARVEGRRAFTPPPSDVPEVRGRRAAARLGAPRASRPALPEVSEPEIVRHYNGLSKKNFDLDTGFYPLGSCTMKHNPKLHERVAALPGPRPPAPAAGPRARPGRARADVAACRARWPRSPGLPHVSLQPSRGLARRAGRPAAHPRLPRGPRRAAHEGAHARHRARHQPGHGDDGRLRGGQGGHRRARRRGHRRPARQGRRRRGLPDAHQPQHARAVRPQHRGDRLDRARRGRPRSTTTGPT